MDLRKDYIKIKNSYYYIIACSVMGEGKVENQDSFDYYYDDEQIIIAVADGLGSATFSKEGSSKIVKILIDLIKKNIEYNILPLELLNHWKEAVNANFNLYDTTVKFIHIKDGVIKYGGIGDGWIVINKSDELVNLCSSNTFSNQTDSILSGDLKNNFTIEEISENNALNMLIATDGFSEDIEKDNARVFLNDIYTQISRDFNAFEEEIKNTLNNWPIKSNKDDKTAIFIQRMECEDD